MRRTVSSFLRSETLRSTLRRNSAVMSRLMPLVRVVRNERRNTYAEVTPKQAARYCYATFLRHYFLLKEAGSTHPEVIMEFGPGDSLGVGLCWLLSGSTCFYALDAERYAQSNLSLAIFDELVKLVANKEQYPAGFPDMLPAFNSYGRALDDFDLSAERLAAIRTAILAVEDDHSGPVKISYIAPWSGRSEVPPASVDLAYSQAVMEHVQDPLTAYRAMGSWVKSGGMLSHNIDFRSHGTSFDWNGHWTYSKSQWSRANNVQTYRAISRVPPSTHFRMMEECGFGILMTEAQRDLSGMKAEHLSSDWRHVTPDDLTSSVVHVIARRH